MYIMCSEMRRKAVSIPSTGQLVPIIAGLLQVYALNASLACKQCVFRMRPSFFLLLHLVHVGLQCVIALHWYMSCASCTHGH